MYIDFFLYLRLITILSTRCVSLPHKRRNLRIQGPHTGNKNIVANHKGNIYDFFSMIFGDNID